jgi:Ca2+-binding EF-hand superfamily protein
MIKARQIAPLVPESVVEALVKAANETSKHQAASALTPRLARALMDPNPTQSKHLIKAPKPSALAASKVEFPSRTPSAGAGVNAAVESCLERLVRRMSGRVKDGGGSGVGMAVSQSLHECDIDSDGHVTRAELVLALKQCGVSHPEKSDVDILMAAFDRSGGGVLNIAALANAVKLSADRAVESKTAPNSAAGGRLNSAKLLEIIRFKFLDKLTPSNVQALRAKFGRTASAGSGRCSASTLLELLHGVGIQGQTDITRDVWSAFGCGSLQETIDFAVFIEHVMMAKSAELDDLFKSQAANKSGKALALKPNERAIKFLRDRITSHLPAMVPRHMMNEFRHHDTNKDNTIDKGEFRAMLEKCVLCLRAKSSCSVAPG